MNTKDHVHHDSGIPFIVRELCSKELKPSPKYMNNWNMKAIPNENNPFMPPFIEQEVVLRHFTSKHRLLFNKFPILKYHLLVITKAFEPQTQKLDSLDIEAAITAISALGDGVVYMNCGLNGGASQPHKHMQVIPESEITLTGGRLPLTIALESSIPEFQEGRTPGPFYLPAFDFKHEVKRFSENITEIVNRGDTANATEIVYKTYCEIYENLGLSEVINHNLIITSEYMCIVKRKHRSFENIDINTPWFLGLVFERTSEKIQKINNYGPLAMLKYVADSE